VESSLSSLKIYGTPTPKIIAVVIRAIYTWFLNRKSKGKVVPLLLLTEHNVMKAYWGMEVLLHAFFGLGTKRR
jgi:hypothetical protein